MGGIIGPRRRLVVPIPHTGSELGQQVTPADLLARIDHIFETAPDPLRAVVMIHAEVSTWRLLMPAGAEPPALTAPIYPKQESEG